MQIHRLGLGLAALGRPGYINLGHSEDLRSNYSVVSMEAHCHAMLDAAYHAGIRHFDTARSYGRAEEFLGNWLKLRIPNDVFISSKWGYRYTADWKVEAEHHEIKEHSLDQLGRQYAESSTTLGANLDLYQIHSATLESGVLENGTVLDELERLKESGLRIGLSTSGPRQSDVIRRALEIQRNGSQLFGSVQCTFNLLESSVESAASEAHDAGWMVIVKESVANGRLTRRNHRTDDSDLIDFLGEEGSRLGCEPDAVSIAWVLSHSWVDRLLSGAATEEQLRSHVRGCALSLESEWKARAARWSESPKDYWQIRSTLDWN